MDPLHDLTHSINIAPVDNTQLTHSEINIEVVSSSIAPASTPIPSPCESTSETEEFDDPYDFNIIIVESDEETDTVSSDVEPVKQFEGPPLWRRNSPFDHDFSYDYLSILSRYPQIGVIPHLQRTIQTPYSTTWNVMERQWRQGIEEVIVTENQSARMCLHFFHGKLHGHCAFWSEGGTVEGEWKNGECECKTISYEKNQFEVTYENELPICVKDMSSHSPILYQYRDGVFTGRWICGKWLHVLETNESLNQIETRSLATHSFHREGKTFVYESNQLRRLDMYSHNTFVETLRWYDGNRVRVMKGDMCVYNGSFNRECLDSPITGFGEIYEKNGNRYRGDVVSGVPHGRGEYWIHGRVFYKGEFRYAVPFGRGVMDSGRYEDSFLFGYRVSDGASFGEYFSGLVIKELCGHLIVGNRLDGDKMEKVFPEYTEDYRRWDQYMRNRRWIEEVQVRQRPWNGVRMASSMGQVGEEEGMVEVNPFSVGRNSVRSQRRSLGNGSMNSFLFNSMSSAQTNSNLPFLSQSRNPSQSQSTSAILSNSLFDSVNSVNSVNSVTSVQTNLPYRNSSASPMTPTTLDLSDFSFDENALKAKHFNSKGKGSLYYSVS